LPSIIDTDPARPASRGLAMQQHHVLLITGGKYHDDENRVIKLPHRASRFRPANMTGIRALAGVTAVWLGQTGL
jgi:hypothetical protein